MAIGVVGGLSDYRKRGQISPHYWHKLLNAHCLTNGRITGLLNIVTRTLRAPRSKKAVSGLLGHFSVERQNDIITQLHRDGFYVFPDLLPDELCTQIHAFACSASAVTEDNRDQKAPLTPFDPARPLSRTYKIRESDSLKNPAIQTLIADPALIAIVETYLGIMPIIGGINVWWSARYGNAPGSDAAQLFHFDFDAPPAWLKLFVYLTDVEADTGPHVYVRGSHKNGLAAAKAFRARGYERIDDEEIIAAFGKDALVEIVGKRGTVFVADTRGFHKGKFPTAGDRLLTQLIYCAPFFSDHAGAIPMPENLTPALKLAMQETPRVYDRFTRNSAP